MNSQPLYHAKKTAIAALGSLVSCRSVAQWRERRHAIRIVRDRSHREDRRGRVRIDQALETHWQSVHRPDWDCLHVMPLGPYVLRPRCSQVFPWLSVVVRPSRECQ
jgi:hypothetical protein